MSAERLGEQHLARAALTHLAEPGDPALGALLEIREPAEVLAAIKAGTLTIDANGASNIELAGSAEGLRIKANGASKLRMSDFTASGDGIIIDANGRIVASEVGSAEWDAPHVVSFLEKVAESAAPSR